MGAASVAPFLIQHTEKGNDRMARPSRNRRRALALVLGLIAFLLPAAMFAQCGIPDVGCTTPGGCDKGEAMVLCEYAKSFVAPTYACYGHPVPESSCVADSHPSNGYVRLMVGGGTHTAISYSKSCATRDDKTYGSSVCGTAESCEFCENGCLFSEALLLCIGCSTQGQYQFKASASQGLSCTVGEPNGPGNPDPAPDPPCDDSSGTTLCITPDGVCRDGVCVDAPPPDACSQDGTICVGNPPPAPPPDTPGGGGGEPGDPPPEPCGTTDAQANGTAFQVNVHCGAEGPPGGGGGPGGGVCDPATNPNCVPCTGDDCGGGNGHCDPTTNPNCVPCPGGDCSGGGEGPCDPATDPDCPEPCDPDTDPQCEGSGGGGEQPCNPATDPDCEGSGGGEQPCNPATDPDCNGNGNGQAGGGQGCDAAPTCSGDAIQCAILEQQWRGRCETAALRGDWDAEEPPAPEGNADGVHTSQEIGLSSLDSSGLGLPRVCPDIPSFTVMGVTVQPPAFHCQLLALIRYMVLLSGLIVSIRILGS